MSMLDSFIMNLDFQQAKSFLRSQNINLCDDEIRQLLPMLKRSWPDLKDPQKRAAVIATLPMHLQTQVQDLMVRYRQYL